ncbi:protease Do-like 1, chloroplastic [Hordeum vulgare]|nr:protease Do-like 1, chloroplastic [Hordeum vulgare]
MLSNYFGLDHTLTTGVISGLRREISSAATGRPIQDVIQTNAAINPGNSGDPLLDSSGNLIGVNTAIYSPSRASSGVGFSIPVDTVGGIVDQLIKFGKVTRPILGIKFAPDQSVEQLGLSGVLVLDAPPNGPAGKAGLQSTKCDAYGRLILGDIITSVNGTKVANGSDLYHILDQCKVGETCLIPKSIIPWQRTGIQLVLPTLPNEQKDNKWRLRRDARHSCDTYLWQASILALHMCDMQENRNIRKTLHVAGEEISPPWPAKLGDGSLRDIEGDTIVKWEVELSEIDPQELQSMEEKAVRNVVAKIGESIFWGPEQEVALLWFDNWKGEYVRIEDGEEMVDEIDRQNGWTTKQTTFRAELVDLKSDSKVGYVPSKLAAQMVDDDWA